MQESRFAYRQRIGDDPDPTGLKELTLQKKLTAQGMIPSEAKRHARAAAQQGAFRGRRPSSPHRTVRKDPITEQTSSQEEDTLYWGDKIRMIGKHVAAEHGEAVWQAVLTRDPRISNRLAPERYVWMELMRWCQSSPGNTSMRIPSLMFYAILTQANLQPLRRLSAEIFRRRLWVLQWLGIHVITEKNLLRLQCVLPLLLHPVERLTETEFRFRTNVLSGAKVTPKIPSYFQILLAETRQEFSRLSKESH